MSNNQNQTSNENDAKYIAGKKQMFKIMQILSKMNDDERRLYITKQQSNGWQRCSIEECISEYTQETIEKGINQYLTDNLQLGDIIIRKEDNIEYLITNYDKRKVGENTYRCVSLKNDKTFILTSIEEIKRTNKNINLSKLLYQIR